MRLGMRLLAPAMAALLLAGCASDYGAQTAAELQARVVTVTDASAAGDWLTASTAVDELAADAADARAEGLITEARYDRIMAAIELVRAELEAAIAAVPEPPADPGEGNEGNGKDDKDDKDNGKKND